MGEWVEPRCVFTGGKEDRARSQDCLLVPHIYEPFAMFSLLLHSVPFAHFIPIQKSLLITPIWSSVPHCHPPSFSMHTHCFVFLHSTGAYIDTHLSPVETVFQFLSLSLSLCLCLSLLRPFPPLAVPFKWTNDVDSRTLWKWTEKFSLSCWE